MKVTHWLNDNDYNLLTAFSLLLVVFAVGITSFMSGYNYGSDVGYMAGYEDRSKAESLLKMFPHPATITITPAEPHTGSWTVSSQQQPTSRNIDQNLKEAADELEVRKSYLNGYEVGLERCTKKCLDPQPKEEGPKVEMGPYLYWSLETGYYWSKEPPPRTVCGTLPMSPDGRVIYTIDLGCMPQGREPQ